MIEKKWIKIWSGGLTAFEIKALEDIENAFCTNSKHKPMTGNFSSIKEMAKVLGRDDDMYPWRGYAGFRFVDSKGYEGEFDLVLITHYKIFIIELKHWNGEITYSNDKWYLNGEDRGRSPVTITQNKTYLLRKKLEPFKQKFTNAGYIPYVEHLVIMTGAANFDALPIEQKHHVIKLEDFTKLNRKNDFYERFGPPNHSKNANLNKDFEIFDDLFGVKNVKPKNFRIGGYIVDEDPDFTHPNGIYQEYLAKTENLKYQESDQALVRRWDFDQLDNSSAKNADGRFRLVTREYDVLEAIKISDEELFSNCLSHKKPPSKQEITSDYIEIFGILPSNKRFNSFIELSAKYMSEDDRLRLVEILLDNFARLHKAKIAHRDIGNHSVWISTGSRITLSGFISAYSHREGTIGDIRDILSVSSNQNLASQISFPKDRLTAYEEDVRALAVLAWHLIKCERLSPASLNLFVKKLDQDSNWYADIFRKALSEEPFCNALDFLRYFQLSKPSKEIDTSFDRKELEPYIRPISHSRAYKEDDENAFILEDSEKEVYLSQGRVVKAWLNIQYENNESTSYQIYKFMEKIASLKRFAPHCIPLIHDFGLAQKSASIYLISDFVEGYSLTKILKLQMSVTQKFEIIEKLTSAVEHLHGLGFYHGDLHPENIIFKVDDQDEARIILLDMLDFTPSQKSNLNYSYAPPTAENASEKERDNFAVMRIASEILGIRWGEHSEDFPELSEVFINELADNKFGFMKLDRFKAALQPKSHIDWIDVVIKSAREADFLIYPDNDELYISFQTNPKNSQELIVAFCGIGGILEFSYDIYKKDFFNLRFKKREEISNRIKDHSITTIPIGIKLSFKQSRSDVRGLTSLFSTDGLLYNELLTFVESLKVAKDEKDKDSSIDASPQDSNLKKFRPSTHLLWEKILKTEMESLPSITPIKFTKKDGFHYLSYECSSDEHALDGIDSQDIVDLIAKNPKTDNDLFVGSIDIQHSTLNMLRLKQEPKNQWVVDQALPLFLQSRENKASFNRRKHALARILNNESIIENLPDYFDDGNSFLGNKYAVEIKDDDFKRYDRNGLSLNEAQRSAFKKIINNGPISLLQGPPGTGKTEFIAAFTHFLFEKQSVRNILLVSQSHEAVNTAAERIRRHCQRLNTPLQVVRFSNRESAVSPELQDTFSQNVISAKREALKASQFKRVTDFAELIGLPYEYISRRLELELELGEDIERHQRLTQERPSITLSDSKEYDRICQGIESNIKNSFSKLFNITNIPNNNFRGSLDDLIKRLDLDFAISIKQSKQAKNLISLSREMLMALSNERVSYDEFLARSRQLVVGTCVGIGQSHIGVGETTYDWVIIDEAARSVSSELAIAMQSGKRILLVGDHKQLPPLYQDEHKMALARSLNIPSRGKELDYIIGSDFERIFESAYGKKVSASLDTQYRMAPAIGTLVSECFYNGKLVNGKLEKQISDIYCALPKHFQSTVTWLSTDNLPNAQHEKRNGSLVNHAEADIIISLLKDLECNNSFLESDIAYNCITKGEAAIGIICMYAEQKQLIRKKFNERPWANDFKELVKIDTVDSYQGKENHIVITSLTRFDSSKTPGFLRLPNRINVALSRAMDKLIIVGATSTWMDRGSHHPLGQVLSMILDKSKNDHSYSVLAAENLN